MDSDQEEIRTSQGKIIGKMDAHQERIEIQMDAWLEE
jgi:hypothetical protein